MVQRISVRRVDAEGIGLIAAVDLVLDVCFDGRRIWSFWSRRDTAGGVTRREVVWPRPLRSFLDGHTRLTVREHVSGRVLFDEEIAFGTSEQRIAVVSPSGAPAGLDKSGRMTATFDTRSAADVVPLLDAVDTVLEAIRAAGIEAFPAYGTLLGAVREGRLLGHDSDADLAYVSRESAPVDVIRESFRLQRAINALGFHTHRYSGGSFRVDVAEGDVNRGLDVFAGFIDTDETGERLYLLGEVGADFRMDWIYPLGTCMLEGRELPAPARPEKLLAVTYGESWAVPDPAFKFTTSEATVRRFNGWFRGTAWNRQAWERVFSQNGQVLPTQRQSTMAQEVLDLAGPGGHVVDIGSGRCRDALWLARQGVRVTAYDYAPTAFVAARRAVEEEGLPLQMRYLNLDELRSVLGEVAWLSRQPGPVTMMARHVADATDHFGRESLVRLASSVLRGGGRLLLEVWTGEGDGDFGTTPVDLDELERLVRDRGGEIVERVDRGPKQDGNLRPFSVGRLVARWN